MTSALGAAPFDHFHPVLLAKELGATPRRVTLHGQAIVLFRDDARIGALLDRCPHRGMQLSLGSVKQGRLVCPYHGWSFASDGQGLCPASPGQRVVADGFVAVERFGAIWLRPRGSSAPFPHFDTDDFHHAGVLRHSIEAPLEVVLDNFIEVEHTGSVHALLGYETARMHEVLAEVFLNEDSVRVKNTGPQRPLPRLFRKLFGVGREDTFVDDWTTRFRPVHSVYDQYWLSPQGERRPSSFRVFVFFTPTQPDRTDLLTFVYAQRPTWTNLVSPLAKRLSLALVELEVRRDKAWIEKLADKSVGFRGTLGRFDRALVESRKRIESIYRGRANLERPNEGQSGEDPEARMGFLGSKR